MSRRRRPGCQGFSLLEALLVLALLSLVWWTLAMLPLGRFATEWRCRLYCDQLAQEFLLSQTQAISQGRIYRVLFESGGNQITIQPLGQPDQMRVFPLPEGWQLLTYLQFHYFPDGRTERFKTVVLLDQATGRRHRIRFQLGSGRFEME